MMIDVFFEKNLKSADEFLNEIKLSGTNFKSHPFPSGLIFRGMPDADYQLIPKAFREDAFVGYEHITNLAGRLDPNSIGYQIVSEIRIISAFFEIADRYGLPFPEDSQVIRGHIKEFKTAAKLIINKSSGDKLKEIVSCWPITDLLSLVGLAQHYGLPTRLLDWTRNPLTAAYFAVSEVVKKYPDFENIDKKIVVWSLDTFDESWFRKSSKSALENENYQIPMKIITSPSENNQNLRAQEALFTLYSVEEEVNLDREVDRRPLDQIIRDWGKLTNSVGAVHHIMCKFTLPWNQAGKLLTLLIREGYTASKLFPGYLGVIDTMKEMKW